MSSGNRPEIRVGSTLSLPWVVVIAISLVAIITSIWAVKSHNDAESLRQEVAELRASANASVYTLEPTDYAPNSIQGQVYISISGAGIVAVSNLPQAGDNEEFRLWYLHDDDSAISGGTLLVNEHGQGFALIAGDSSGYTRIAISLETGTVDSPTGNYLMIADVKPGRG